MEELEERADPGEETMTMLLRLAGPRESPSAERAARVRAFVAARWQDAVRARRLRRGIGATLLGLAAAAGLAVAFWPRPAARPPASPVVLAEVVRAVGSAGYDAQGRRATLRAGALLSAATVLETERRGRAVLRLEGGASLRIDVDSGLTLLSAGVLSLERGGLYADTGPDGGNLEIRTPRGTVQDVGTQFEVRLGPAGLGIRVREGRVRLSAGGLEADVARGERLTLTRALALDRGTLSAHAPEWDWAVSLAPPFEIEGRRLEELLRWVAHETGRPVRLADVSASTGDQILHGSLEGLEPLAALDAVLPACGLRFRLEGDEVVVGPAESR
jgi:ferric-dicitrate binding protein FerR (iron transport regulator)